MLTFLIYFFPHFLSSQPRGESSVKLFHCFKEPCASAHGRNAHNTLWILLSKIPLESYGVEKGKKLMEESKKERKAAF